MIDDLQKIAANKNPLQNRKQLKEILTVIYDKIGEILQKYDYRIVGTATSLLQNVSIFTNDIDILFRERKGIDEVHKIFPESECLREPEFLGDETGGQYLAIYEVSGITVVH